MNIFITELIKNTFYFITNDSDRSKSFFSAAKINVNLNLANPQTSEKQQNKTYFIRDQTVLFPKT
ncbi:hypothetical protein BOW55_04490 [Flavobacterium sp. YO12]|nr:hypothetical protein BOW55_04490 [Flavobacterium sp. YO12]